MLYIRYIYICSRLLYRLIYRLHIKALHMSGQIGYLDGVSPNEVRISEVLLVDVGNGLLPYNAFDWRSLFLYVVLSALPMPEKPLSLTIPKI